MYTRFIYKGSSSKMNQALLVYNRVVLELKFLAHLVKSQALLAAFEHNKARLGLFCTPSCHCLNFNFKLHPSKMKRPTTHFGPHKPLHTIITNLRVITLLICDLSLYEKSLKRSIPISICSWFCCMKERKPVFPNLKLGNIHYSIR